MAKIFKIKDVLEMDADSLIQGAFIGTVKKVWPVKMDKENETPEWKFQGLWVADSSGKQIEVTLKNRPDDADKSWIGQSIVITAKKGNRGWSGMRAVDNKKSGARQILITPSATIEVGNDDNAEPEEPDEEREETPKAKGKGKPAPEESDDSADEEGDAEDEGNEGEEEGEKPSKPKSAKELHPQTSAVLRIMLFLGQAANGHALAASASLNAIKAYCLKEGLSTEESWPKDSETYKRNIATFLCEKLLPSLFMSVVDHDEAVNRQQIEDRLLIERNIFPSTIGQLMKAIEDIHSLYEKKG